MSFGQRLCRVARKAVAKRMIRVIGAGFQNRTEQLESCPRDQPCGEETEGQYDAQRGKHRESARRDQEHDAKAYDQTSDHTTHDALQNVSVSAETPHGRSAHSDEHEHHNSGCGDL